MTNEQKKEIAIADLNKLKGLDGEYRWAECQLNRLKRDMGPSASLGSSWSDGEIKGSRQLFPTIDQLTKLTELGEELGKCMERCIEEKLRVLRNIDKLEDGIHRYILKEKYISGKTLKDIKDLSPSYDSAKLWHGEALLAYYEVIAKKLP